MSRCRKPTSARRFGQSRRPKLWDSALPKQGLPQLPDNHFEKAHGAPIIWETLYRSKPQHELETDRMGGMLKEAKTPHPHFHIFASLPGLNDPAFMRRGVPPPAM